MNELYGRLLGILRRTEGAAIAFSGGVDSTFLLHAAQEALGDRVLAVTATTPYIPRWEVREAQEATRTAGVKHVLVELPFPEEIRHNPPDHCYTCKKILFTRLWEVARENGFSHLLDGTNLDDMGDYRPGLKALRELHVNSPLKDAGLRKQDIRDLSRHFGLPTWDKPSFACLLSRIPADTEVTDDLLRRIETAELVLMESGFPAVRVRAHGDVARIELPPDRIRDLLDAAGTFDIDARLKELGFKHVSVDLAGYTMGSLNAPE